MKYLKIFEEYDDEYDDRLYHKITEQEWIEAVGYESGEDMGFEDFTESEIESISDCLDTRIDLDNFEYHYIINLDAWRCKGVSDGWPSYSLTKMKDEWFYVWDKDQYLYYKCDTFEGLINCISGTFPLDLLK